MRRRDLFPLAALAAAPVGAQTAPASAARLMTYLEAEAGTILAQAERELASKEAWEPLRAQRRRELQQMLGLDPWPQRTPLNVQVRGRIDRDDYIIEKIAFESIPRFYVSANLYLPKQRTGRVPGIVYVCGHAIVPQGAKTAYQRHGITFARNGYACLIVDPIQIAEVFALHHGVYAMQQWDWYARGYAPAGVDVWNAIRAFDYLETRPEIDASKFAITGRSGGAAMSWFTAALDPRIQAAAPIMGISTYLHNIRANTQKGHCDCMFPLNFHRHDMTHQGALIAPRPLLMAHGVKDDLFPVPGYTKFEEVMTGLYRSYGAADKFRNVVVDTGHADSDYLREQVLRWFDTHLLKTNRPPEMTYRNAEADTLRVFDGRPPADAINPKVHLVFRPRGTRTTVEQLRANVFQHLPRMTGEPQLRLQNDSANAPALLYITPDGEEAAATTNLLRLGGLPGNVTRAILHTRDWSETARRPNEYRDLLRNSMHVGLTPETIRLKDVLTAAERLHGRPRLVLAGRGTDAGVAIYAALLDPKITGLLLLDAVESHTAGPIFLNILRYTDLPGAAALVAPRPVRFLHRMPDAYRALRQPTMQEIYTLEAAFA